MTVTREVVAYALSDVDAQVRFRVEALLGVLPLTSVWRHGEEEPSAAAAASPAELYIQVRA